MPYGKLRCMLSEHEMPATLVQFEKHITSVKYQKALAQSKLESSFANVNVDTLSPFLVKHKRFPNMMYCTLTKVTLKRSAEELITHRNGRSYCKTLYTTWRRKMRKKCKKLVVDIRRMKKRCLRRKINPLSRLVNFFPDRASLRSNRYKRLISISRRNVLITGKRL